MRALPMNQFLVLDALMHPDRALAASQIVATIPSLSRASAYAAITKLQADGRVSAQWETPESGQARRLFAITALGRQAWNDARRRMGVPGGQTASVEVMR
jgi:DNA-binding PadR family transcriptional regulator